MTTSKPKFELPESLTEVEDLQPLLDSALDEYGELAKIDEAELTDEQIDRIDTLAAGVEAIKAEAGVREAAANERAERVAAAKAKLDSAAAEPEENDEDESTDDAAAEVDEDPLPDDVIIPDDASEITEGESVTASAAGTSKSVVRRAAARAPKVVKEEEAPKARASLVASADVPGFSTGQAIADIGGLTEAFMARLGGMPTRKLEGVTNRYGVAHIQKAIDPEFALVRGDQEGNFAKIMRAAQQDRLPSGSLTAAGGWCAPSETVYNILTLETVSGILDLPEVTIARGGISFTKGPDFSDIYTAAGFLQTEAQAEAGTEKTFIDVECPGFTEVRLDAIGYGVRAGILTNSAWPELVRRYIEGTLVAHAHKVNASKISRINTLLGVALNATEFGSAVSDTLAALELRAIGLRYKFRMDPNATMEGYAPIWLLGVLRRDFSLRNGINEQAVTLQMVNGWLAARNIRLQWVYDWQDLAENALDYPATVQVALYPVGSYVAGTTDIISMDAVHDYESLKVNTFTAAFFEEGIMVFNPVGNGRLVEIALDSHGRTGATDITSLTEQLPLPTP